MIRIGVVGHGSRISGVVKHLLREVEPDIRVVGIVDPDEAGARSGLAEVDQKDVVFYKTLDRMVRAAKLDCLAIGTRCNLHAPYAIEAAPRGTSTDADAIFTARHGIATGLVSVPCRYMHSPNEMVSVEDLDRVAQLLAAWAGQLGPATSFIPS